MNEVDILRTNSKDLLVSHNREQIRSDVRSGEYDAAITTPPCDSTTRVQWANNDGPRPVRDATHLDGFPWLTPKNKIRAQIGNVLMDFSLDLAQDAHSAQTICRYLAEHPEHLGKLKRGEPGSMWLRPKAIAAADLPGFYGMGIKQCRWAHYPKPTRLLSDIPGLAKEGWVGPPMLDDKRIYIGPIPACTHSHKVELVGRSRSGQHMTKETECAAWPPGMCEMVAKHIVNDFLENPCRRKAAEPVLARGVEGSAQAEPDTSDEDSDGQVRPKLGAGHWGRGPPRACGTWLRPRQFHDGGGLCSPGRWKKPQRILPSGTIEAVRTELTKTIIKFASDSGQVDWVNKVFWSLIRGGLTHDPFSAELLGKMRATTSAVMAAAGQFDCTTVIDEGQPFLLDMHASLLRISGDPDYRWLVKCKKGVRNGVNSRMPRVPAIYERKLKWALPEVSEEEFLMAEKLRDNYETISGSEAQVLKQFEAEQQEGMMLALEPDDAHQRYQDTLCVASLGGDEKEDGSIRVLHDGTHGTLANNRIRLRDQPRSPCSRELERVMQDAKEEGGGHIALTADNNRAHRRVKTDELDWGTQACRLSPSV